MLDTTGDFQLDTTTRCPKCEKLGVQWRFVPSHVAPEMDKQYKCFHCGNIWWVDGSKK